MNILEESHLKGQHELQWFYCDFPWHRASGFAHHPSTSGPKGVRMAETLASPIPLSSFWLVGFRSCHSHQSEQVDVSLADTVGTSWARSAGSPPLWVLSCSFWPVLVSSPWYPLEIQFYMLLVLSVDCCILLIWKQFIFNDSCSLCFLPQLCPQGRALCPLLTIESRTENCLLWAVWAAEHHN